MLWEKPDIATVALEGMVLFSNNATRAWLESKSPKQRAEIFDVARKLAPSYRQQFKARRARIWNYVREEQKEKQRKAEEKRRKTQLEKEQ